MRRNPYPLATALLGLALLAVPALAHSPDEHANHQPSPQQLQPQGSTVRFADVTLLDQHARPVRLQDDLVRDRIVVMSFVYTTCTTVCPVVSAIMQKVQDGLDARSGARVQLVSISVDPLRDTPERLRDYARNFRSGPDWHWLTGSSQAVKETLQGLGTWSADYVDHQPVILVGDGDSDRWTRYYGFTDPAVLLAKVEQLSARHSHAGHHATVQPGDRR